LIEATNVEESKLCRACFSGVYPIAIPTDMSEGKMRLEVTDIHTDKVHK
jgi:amidophosphoribosyltransferase